MAVLVNNFSQMSENVDKQLDLDEKCAIIVRHRILSNFKLILNSERTNENSLHTYILPVFLFFFTSIQDRLSTEGKCFLGEGEVGG